MEIKYGVPVKDASGNVLGSVNRVIRDSWSGDIRRFAISRENSAKDLFLSPEDVLQSTDTEVKLKFPLDEDSES